MQGRIKNVNSRGFGFIETEQQIDFFFHFSQFKGNWKTLLQKHVSGKIIVVKFDNDDNSDDGPRALNVEIEQIMDGKNLEENTPDPSHPTS
jgi:''Cold-shock'' DNA-binding domain.